MSDIYEFEPGASEPLFIQLKESAEAPDFIDLTGRSIMLSVMVEEACIPINGVYDAANNRFALDVNELAEFVKPRNTYTGYFYLDGNGGWVRAGTVRIKPITGCIWKPIEV